MNDYILWFDDPGAYSVERVGGKNASLAQMIQLLGPQGIRVPQGFAVTVAAYRAFIEHNALHDPIKQHLNAFEAGTARVEEAGAAIRRLLGPATLPGPVATAIRTAYS